MVIHRLLDTIIFSNESLTDDILDKAKKANPFLPTAMGTTMGKAPPLALLLHQDLPMPFYFYAYLKSWSDTEAVYNSSGTALGPVIATFSFSPSADDFAPGHAGPIVCFVRGQLCSQRRPLYQIANIIDDLVPDLSSGT